MEGREDSKRKKGVRSTDTDGGGMKEICLDQGVKKKLGLSTEEVRSEISTESNKRKKKKKSNAEEKEGDGEGKKRWDAAPEYFQFLALHWHAVSTAHPGLDGSQVQGKLWKKWVRGGTPKPARPKIREERTRKSVEVTRRALKDDGFF